MNATVITDSFRQELLAFLGRVFEHRDSATRELLLSNFPRDLVAEVPRHSACWQDLNAIVHHAEQWGRLANGTQALEVVLENTRRFVQGATAEQELEALKAHFRQLLEACLKDQLQVAGDQARPRDTRHEAAQCVADTIDRQCPLDFLSRLESAYAGSADDPTPCYWIALALGYTGRPEARDVLERLLALEEQHPYAKEGIQQALKMLG
jgi:hypothetical protein